MDKDFLEECVSNGMSTRDIEKICDKDHRTISYWLIKYGLNKGKSESYKFEKIDTKEKAYALGFILADASISYKNDVEISVSLYDKKAANFIASVICGNVRESHKLNKSSGIFPKARLVKRINDITKFTGGLKKEDRHYPRVSPELERYLIQGFFDGDGCITWGRRKDRNRIWQKISFTSQLKMLEGVQKYLIKNLSISTIIRPKGNENCYVLSFSNKTDVLKFCEHIYPNEDFIVLNRKYLKYKALRLELEENGGSNRSDCQYRAEPAEQEGVETSGDSAKDLNNRN